MNADAAMQFLGELDSCKCFWAAPGQFVKPGFYFWNGTENVHVALVDKRFLYASSKAAIKALRGLEQTAIMLETYAPDIFPEVNEAGQIHFGQAMIDRAAESIRKAWSDAIADVQNESTVKQIDAHQPMLEALELARTVLRELSEIANTSDALAKIDAAIAMARGGGE